jgi:hypothetical protein
MRGDDNRTGELFSYVDLEARVRSNHPLRAIRTIVNEALAALAADFAALYSPIGRPSIPPEKLLIRNPSPCPTFTPQQVLLESRHGNQSVELGLRTAVASRPLRLRVFWRAGSTPFNK